LPKVPIAEPAEAKEEAAKNPELEKAMVLPEILSPPAEAELPKVAKDPATTPKRRRMASVLDAVMESTKALTPTAVKKVVETVKVHVETKARPSVPAETEPIAIEQTVEQRSLGTSMALEKDAPEMAKTPIPEAPSEDFDFIIRHASGKRLSEEEIAEARHYAWELKYPKGRWCTMARTKMTSYIVSQTIRKYLSTGRWLRIWDFRNLKLGSLPCQRMTLQTALHTTV
jgi:hypothetical protein